MGTSTLSEVTAMLILGLLLLGGTAAFTGLALADNLNGGPNYNVTVLGHQVATMNSLAIFCAGLALALIFGLGAMLATGGMSLRRRKSRKLAGARRDAADAARERDELAARLENTNAVTVPDYATTADTDYAASRESERDTVVDNTGTARSDTAPRHRTRHLFGH
jgi:hypothetical protein